MNFENKVGIVTGSGRGIGKATAMRLASDGASGVVIVDLVRERLAKAETDIEALGADVLTMQTDVTDSAQVSDMVATTMEKFGRIDILVNNVGGTWGSDKIDVSENDWDGIFALNLKSQFLCAQAVVPHMSKQGGGRIVNVSSSAGRYRSVFTGSPYVSAKAGVMGLTRQLALELAEYNIAVNSVVPGNVGSEEGEKDWLELPADMRDFVMKSTPIKRLARPEELAAAIAFLASDDASYITGVSLDVNGGLWTS